jgi:hypothetical protein
MLFNIFIILVTISCSVLGYEIVLVIIDPNAVEFAPSSI